MAGPNPLPDCPTAILPDFPSPALPVGNLTSYCGLLGLNQQGCVCPYPSTLEDARPVRPPTFDTGISQPGFPC